MDIIIVSCFVIYSSLISSHFLTVQCLLQRNRILQHPKEPTAGVFVDNCTFPAMQNINYEDLANNGTCLANQSCSGGDPICVA